MKRLTQARNKPYLHTYCVYRISRIGTSQAAIAQKCNCTPTTVNQIIRGNRTSAALQLKIAILLGFDSWKSLDIAALLFQTIEVRQRRMA